MSNVYTTTEVVVGFKVGCKVAGRTGATRAARFWCDQPQPPPGWPHRWPDPERPWARSWHGRSAEDIAAAPTARAEQARFFTGVTLEVGRCVWTYRRVVLIGEVLMHEHRYSPRPITAADAAHTLLLTLSWTLTTLYDQPVPAGGLDAVPLPGLHLAVTERARRTVEVQDESWR